MFITIEQSSSNADLIVQSLRQQIQDFEETCFNPGINDEIENVMLLSYM